MAMFNNCPTKFLTIASLAPAHHQSILFLGPAPALEIGFEKLDKNPCSENKERTKGNKPCPDSVDLRPQGQAHIRKNTGPATKRRPCKSFWYNLE